MEIKEILKKTYTERQRQDFIVENNHKKGYKIEETEEEMQAFGYTADEIAEQETEAEQKRKSKLKMTKRDFFLYILQPFGISYSGLMQALQADDTLLACYEGCNHIYRYDEMLVGNIKQILENLTEQEIEEQELNKMLDSVFAEHNAID